MNKIKKERLDLSATFNQVLDEIIAEDPQQTFYFPVDTKIFFDYTKKIETPMDLQTMQRKVKMYSGFDEFKKDLQLIWSNCQAYNQENSEIHKASMRLEKFSLKCLKDHIAQFKSQYKFDEKGLPVKKRKYNRVKEENPVSKGQESGMQLSSSGQEKKVIQEESSEGRANLLGKTIVKKNRTDQQKLERKKNILNGKPSNTNTNISQNGIALGLQAHFIGKDNQICEEDRRVLRERISKFSQEQLFKCIKTIQEFEPQKISQVAKEQYTVDLNSITKTTFSKIKEQFAF